MRFLKPIISTAISLVAAAVALAGCSSGNGGGSPSSSGGGTSSSSSQLTSVDVIEAGSTPGRLPFYAALYGGIFQKYGLKVNLLEAQSGSQAAQLLAGDKVQFELGQVVDGLNVAQAGVPIDALALLTDKYENTVVVGAKYKDKVKNFSDLAGVPIGITGVGSGTWQLANFVGQQGHLSSSQLDMVNVGTASITSGQSLISGRIGAQVATDPADLKLVDSGAAYFLADPLDISNGASKQYPGFVKLATEPYIYTWAFSTKSYVSANPAITQKFLDALQAGENLIFKNTPAQTAALLTGNEELGPFGQQLLTQLVTRLRDTSKSLPATLAIPQVNYTNTVAFATQLKSSYSSVAYSSVVDNQFADKAAKSVGTGS
jgi:ABC-type nitrate/sulfonate/bicarbonate transport system substrate-binding protein